MDRRPWPMLIILFGALGFIAPKTLNYLAFQSFKFEGTCCNDGRSRIGLCALNLVSSFLFLLCKQ